MSHKCRLTNFGNQVGFTVKVEANIVQASEVPCLLAGGVVGSCIIKKSYDPTSGKPNKQIGGETHAVYIKPRETKDGLVYNADGTAIGNYIGGDNKTWSNISIKKGAFPLRRGGRQPQ